MSEQAGTRIEFDQIPCEEVRITVSRGDIEFSFFFKPLVEDVLRRYRTIYAGPPGSRRGKPKEALEYLFRNSFTRTEGVNISKYTEPQNGDQPRYRSEADFWLKEPRAGLWTDSAIDG